MDPDRLKHPSSSNRNKEDIREETASRYMALGVQISRSGESFENPLRLKVTSGSMSPLMRPGDAIYLEFAEPESLKRGDIVTFPVDQNLMTHRLIYTSPVALPHGRRRFTAR